MANEDAAARETFLLSGLAALQARAKARPTPKAPPPKTPVSRDTSSSAGQDVQASETPRTKGSATESDSDSEGNLTQETTCRGFKDKTRAESSTCEARCKGNCTTCARRREGNADDEN